MFDAVERSDKRTFIARAFWLDDEDNKKKYHAIAISNRFVFLGGEKGEIYFPDGYDEEGMAALIHAHSGLNTRIEVIRELKYCKVKK